MPKPELNHTTQDYLRAIYRVTEREGRAATTALARELGVSPAAVTEMVRRLDESGLLEYRPYRGVQLSVRGMRHAVDLTRRHRLWEVFLIEHLGFEWDEVHEIADELEHVGSDDMIDRLEAYLGNPTHDPHGDEIPRRDGTVRRRALVAVSSLQAGQEGVIARVQDEIPELLRYASTLGLEIGTRLMVLERIEFDASVRVVAGRREAVISGKLADSIWLERTVTPRARARRGGGR